MKALAVMVLAAMALAACGTDYGDRTASGALIGGGIGLVGGPPGVVVGALAGGATGALTSPGQVDLGRPVWRG